MANPQPPNQPPNQQPAVAVTWENLVEDATFPTASLARAMATAHMDTPISVVLDELDAVRAIIDGAAEVKERTRMAEVLSELEPRCHLLACDEDKQVVVAHTFAMCPKLAGGTRVTMLIGDRSDFLPPGFARFSGQANNEHNAFGRIEDLRPLPVDEILATMDNDDEAILVDPNPQQDAEAPGPIRTLKIFPLHPKFGCFFMGGLSPKAALLKAQQLKGLLPDAEKGRMLVLEDWLRASATKAVAGANNAMTAVGVSIQNPTASVELRKWVEQLVKHKLPSFGGTPAAAARNDTSGQGQDLQMLMSAVLSERKAEATEKMQYHAHEMKALAQMCGLAQPHDGVTVDQLPPFWREFMPIRSKKTGVVRGFVETYIRDHRPVGHSEVPFAVTTEFLTTLKDVSFGTGGVLSWANRHKGFTLFAVEPAESAAHVAMKVTEMRRYEESERVLTPADRAAAELVYASRASLPMEIYKALNWMSHFLDVTITLFGGECPLYTHGYSIREKLRSSANFPTIGSYGTGFQVIMWCYASGCDHFCNTGNEGPLKRLVADINGHVCFETSRLPPELRAPRLPPYPAGGIERPPGNPPSGNEDQRRQKAAKVERENTATYVSTLRAEWDKAARANPSARLRELFTCPGSPYKSAPALFGPEWDKFRAGDQELCANFHLRGACFARWCPHLHHVSEAPSDHEVMAVKRRLNAAVEHYVKELKGGGK